jgi:AcrR family transcriptional regulator
MKAAATGPDRRAEILAAAIRVLARDGIAQATTRRIAAEAGINQATLLYYVGSKDELFLAVLREMMRVTGEIALAAYPLGLPLRDAIRRGITAFWEHVEAEPELQVLQYELTLYALRNPTSAWLAREQYQGYSAVVEGLLREACAACGVTCAIPLDAAARFVVGGLDGMILQFISDRDTARARRGLNALIVATVALVEGTANVTDNGTTGAERAEPTTR